VYRTSGSISSVLGAFHMAEVSMRYSLFVPRLYNLALSLGFEKGKIMPSRAFCSDESQGYPIILIAKHFGTFPFNHGRVGGIVATDRHGPHAHHGKDLIIVQASHVGYDPQTGSFGIYRRLQTEHQEDSTSCGKICGAIDWYLHEYEFAKQNIFLTTDGKDHLVIIDNQLLHTERDEGLLLKLERLINLDDHGTPMPKQCLSTSKVFKASSVLESYLDNYEWKAEYKDPIGEHLHPDLFFYRRDVSQHAEGGDHLEPNLLEVMPYVVTSKWPALTAAQANTQVEFDRAYRTIIKEPAYQGKKLLFIAGLNVDISPQPGQFFPLTKFIPWAAYYQDEQGKQQTWEQTDLFEQLIAQSTENSDQIDMETAIEIMGNVDEIKLPF